MPDRLSELTAKQKAGRLTPQEQLELTNLLYSGQLPTQPQGSHFVSRHRMTITDVPARLRGINWFANCGRPASFDVTMEIERSPSWERATKALKGGSWENPWLEARNQLTEFLTWNCRERSREWRKISERFTTEVVTPLKTTIWEPFRKANSVDRTLVDATEWSVLGALMENEYMDCNHHSYFFLEVLTVYEAGHLPCGWRGEWPQGKLVVF